MSTNSVTSEFLACPECGGERFSWIIHQVQFGGVHRFPNGQVDVEASKDGPITGADIGENGVFCVGCGKDRTYDDLVPTDHADTTTEGR
ncbi:hypothetical protein [Haloglomus halophilum]|uniref:hypothetical protein n=1 Tax=Haloglomus halophilum TaxID=2962672 RepID=UPI0020C960F3|nr:hypothetical protein [Haloglomus halophilum]